jgi:hypothetical protein
MSEYKIGAEIAKAQAAIENILIRLLIHYYLPFDKREIVISTLNKLKEAQDGK